MSTTVRDIRLAQPLHLLRLFLVPRFPFILYPRRGCLGLGDGDLLYLAVVPLDRDAAVLVPEVRRLRHMAEEADLDDAGKHLDPGEQLHRRTLCQRDSSRNNGKQKERGNGTYGVGLLHELFGEGRINDKVAVIGDDRARFRLRHAQLRVRRAYKVQILQDLLVREGHDLDRDALLPLRAIVKLETASAV